jgi:GAF domain-containing protein
VPIYLSDGALFGTMCALDPEPTPITDEMIGVVLALAAQVGSALSADGAMQAPLDPVGDDGRLESA